MTQQPLPGASTVLTLGIISVVGALICCGPFAAIFSVIGLVRAKKAEQLFHEHPGEYHDLSSVKTGKILCYIGLVISVILLALLILYFGVIIALISTGEYNQF